MCHFEAENCQKYQLYGKKFKIKVFGISIFYEKLRGRHVYLLPEWSEGVRKVTILMLKIGKYSHFEAKSCQIYQLYGKKFKIKVFDISIPYQKFSGAHMPAPPRAVVGGFSLLK